MFVGQCCDDGYLTGSGSVALEPEQVSEQGHPRREIKDCHICSKVLLLTQMDGTWEEGVDLDAFIESLF